MPVDDVHDLVAQAGVDLLRGERLARLVVDRAHADEPLVDEAEQERRAAPPAVRIAVGVRLEVVEAGLRCSRSSTIGSATSRTSRPVSQPKPST